MNKPPVIDHNPDLARRNRAGILYGICFILFAAAMAGIHWLMTGISVDFGTGFVVGAFLGVGLFALASRRVREMD